jgi:hypothetical protein
MHIQYIYTGMQIYPKYIYKDLRFHPYSTIHATARSTKTRSGRWHCHAAVTVARAAA